MYSTINVYANNHFKAVTVFNQATLCILSELSSKPIELNTPEDIWKKNKEFVPLLAIVAVLLRLYKLTLTVLNFDFSGSELHYFSVSQAMTASCLFQSF